MKKKILMLALCFCFVILACGAHSHTTTVGVCADCGQVQNEALLGQINTDFAKMLDEGNALIPRISDVAFLDADRQYQAFLEADKNTEEIKKLCAEVIDACKGEQELSFLVYQISLVEKACPMKIAGSDPVSLSNQSILYQLYLQQLSNSFNFLSQEMKRLAGEEAVGRTVAFFDELPEMPTPDSVIFGSSLDEKKTVSGTVQYMYLLGRDAADAGLNYNNYISAIEQSGDLQVTIEGDYCIITRNGTMVSAMMSGEDSIKGFFVLISFQA